MVDLEGTIKNVNVYNLGTIGAANMISEAGASLALSTDNNNTFPEVIALFQLASGSGTDGSGQWNFRGCYVDNTSHRSLAHVTAVPGGSSAMTVEACQTACKGLGYTLAGLEFATQCCKCCCRRSSAIQQHETSDNIE